MNVLLITPSVLREERFKRGSESSASFMPPLGLAYIAAYIQKFDHQVDIVDGLAENHSLAALIQKASHYDVLGVSTTSAYYLRAKESVAALRKAYPDKLILAGGAHVTTLPDGLLHAGADIAVIGEGELTTKEILDWYANQDSCSLDQILGIAYKAQDGRITKTPRRPPIDNLDIVPMPALNLLPMHKYGVSIARSVATPSLPLMTSRGCMGICSFCNHSMFGKRIRRFSPERVVNDFFRLRDEYGANSIGVWDDNFIEDADYARAVCQELIARGFDKPFSVEARVDAANPEILQLLKDAGCDYIAYGFETGTQRLLDYVKKRQTLEQMWEAVRITKKIGLKIRGYFILGFPTETKEEMEATVALAKAFDIDVASFTLFCPFPGTLDYIRAQKEGDFDPLFYEHVIIPEFNFLDTPLYSPAGISKKELLNIHKNAYSSYYFRPQIILRKLMEVRSATDVANLLKAGRTLIKNALFRAG